jgi:nucleotide-binding universal stress UspA family protein
VSIAVVLALVVIAAAGGIAVGRWRPPRGRRAAGQGPAAVRRILLPFTGPEISRRAVDAAVRLAKAEGATIMLAFLARVPRNLPLDAPLLVQCGAAMPLMDAIEQRAASQGIEVDARVARGRTYRDALRRLLEQERFDRVIVSATNSRRAGLGADDLEWLLEGTPAEVMILRPAADDTAWISPDGQVPERGPVQGASGAGVARGGV